MITPDTNSLTYRGYPVQELAGRCSFEEAAYLLWHGELPTPAQLTAQNRAERAQRRLDPVIAATLIGLPLTAHPMDTLRTAVSLLGAADPHENDNSPGAKSAEGATAIRRPARGRCPGPAAPPRVWGHPALR